MFDYECPLVRLCVLLILLLQHCSTGVAKNNQQKPIDQCRFHIQRYWHGASSSASYGVNVLKGEIAHMAAIGWSQPNGTIIWQCGGSLIWENYVLTAAHCAEDGSNTAPDVVLFGDVNLLKYNRNNLRKIIEIIRHPHHKFSQKYHDIALLRLETNVSFEQDVVKACLWNDDHIPFKRMEAAGWGATGFGENNSPDLLKVSLSQVDSEQCSGHYLNTRGLHAGLHANQICAGDEKMDTCRGDSGGSLHVKLLHNNMYTPFIVGVTSFGSACGLSVPGVYTRVAPYIPWIQSVVQERGENVIEGMFQPHTCAMRHVEWRRKMNIVDYVSKIERSESLHHVTIHWDGVIASKKIGCYGVVVDEHTILTLASCTVMDGMPPSHIRYKGDNMNAVSNFFRHPEYKENSLYNNIGLLKLKESLVFSNDFFPACLYLDDGLDVQHVRALGHKLRLWNRVRILPKNLVHYDLDVSGDVHNDSKCSLPSEYASMLEKGLTEELLCFGSDQYLLPDTCHLSVGGPIEFDVPHADVGKFPYAYALNMLGRNCGYGESALGVKISYHREWLRSILVPKEDKNDAPLIFLNDALEEGDHCPLAHGSDGICVEAKYCPKMYYQFQTEGQVTFCQTGSLMCCPQEFIRNGTDAEWRQIDECENHHANGDYEDLDRTVVSLGWKTETGEKTCLGTIITSRTIVVAANCVAGTESPANVSLQGSNDTVLPVERVIVHPEYDNSTKKHNIALIHMHERLDKSFRVKPACLLITDDHFPVNLDQFFTDGRSYESRPVYSSECARYLEKRVIQPYELCTTGYGWNTKSLDVPALWRSKKDPYLKVIAYLIGITSQESWNEHVLLHTRVSSYVSWIKSVL